MFNLILFVFDTTGDTLRSNQLDVQDSNLVFVSVNVLTSYHPS